MALDKSEKAIFKTLKKMKKREKDKLAKYKSNTPLICIDKIDSVFPENDPIKFLLCVQMKYFCQVNERMPQFD